MSENNFLESLSDERSARSHAGIYATVFLLAALILVPLTIFVLTRPTRLKPAAAPNATLALSPTNNSVTIGDQFNIFVTLNTKENTTDAVDVTIFYDSSKLKVYDAIKTDNMPYATVVGKQENACGGSQNGLRGKITFSGLAYDASQLPTPPPHSPVKTGGQTVTIATIPFEAIAAGSANVQFNFDSQGSTTDSNVVETSTSQDLLNTVTNAVYTITAGDGTPTPTPCPNVTATPTVTPTPGEGQATPTPTVSATPTPDEVACGQPDYDMDCDGLVCAPDVALLIANWRKEKPPYLCFADQRPDCNPDFDHDGNVYAYEVSVLMSHWSGPNCSLRITPTVTP